MSAKNNLKYCSDLIYRNLEGIKKDGKFKYNIDFSKKEYIDINCFDNDKISFLIQNNSLKKEKQDIDKEELEKQFQNYSRYNIKTITYKNYRYIYKKKFEKKVILYLFIQEKIIPKLLNKYNSSKKEQELILLLTYYFYMYKLQFFKTPNSKIIVILFFVNYTKLIKEEIYKKYKINISLDINNYHNLYLFLKEKGYVQYFYNILIAKIKQQYKIIKKEKIDTNNIYELIA